MTSLFEQELIAMEQEVRDLKTIHLRGLGTTRFYSGQATAENNQWVTFEAHVAADEPTPAIMQGLINVPEPVNSPHISFAHQTYGGTFTFYNNGTQGQVSLTVISSSVLSQVVKQ